MNVLSNLPDEIIVHIMTFLNVSSLCNLDLTAKRYRKLSESNVIWNIRLKKVFPWLKPESIPQSNHQDFVKSILELIKHVKQGIIDKEPDAEDVNLRKEGGIYIERYERDFIVDKPPYNTVSYMAYSCKYNNQIYLKPSVQLYYDICGIKIFDRATRTNKPIKRNGINKMLKKGSYKEIKKTYHLDRTQWEFGLSIGYLIEQDYNKLANLTEDDDYFHQLLFS